MILTVACCHRSRGGRGIVIDRTQSVIESISGRLPRSAAKTLGTSCPEMVCNVDASQFIQLNEMVRDLP